MLIIVGWDVVMYCLKKGIERLRGMNNSGVGGWRAIIISQL